MKTNTKLFFIFASLIVIDQLTKKYSSVFICNKNIAWSISVVPAIFYTAWIVIVAALIYSFTRTINFSQKALLIFILAGATSNIIDRIRFKCVIDFIDLKFWPVFNLADIFIAIGIAMLLLKIIKKSIPLSGTQ